MGQAYGNRHPCYESQSTVGAVRAEGLPGFGWFRVASLPSRRTLRSPCGGTAGVSRGRSGTAQKRVGKGETAVGNAHDPACTPGCVTVDEVAHHLKSDIGNRLGANGQSEGRFRKIQG